MNIKKFLKEVNINAEKMTKEELDIFVYEIAKKLPERHRMEFLQTMKTTKKLLKDIGKDVVMKNTDEEVEKLLEEIANINIKINEISEGKYLIEVLYNDEWNDWYDSDDEGYIYSDTNGVAKYIEKAIELIHFCVDMEEFVAGYELATNLSTMEIMLENKYGLFCEESMTLSELEENDLITVDYNKFVIECGYLAYMANKLEDRAEKMYMILEELHVSRNRLEDIYIMGDCNLPEFDEFIKKWIEYLLDKKGYYVEELLKEDYDMIEDESILLQNAKEYAKEQPTLYELLINKKIIKSDKDGVYGIYEEAMQNLPIDYKVRSGTALQAAEYICKQKDYDYVEKCWIEAFRSDSNLTNYMRAICNTKQREKVKEKLRIIYQDFYQRTKNNRFLSMSNITLNNMDKEMYYAIMFFDGDFDNVYKNGMNCKYSLGWSSTFMKEGIALFLLLLVESNKLGKGCTTMLHTVVDRCHFVSEEYIKGTDYKLEDRYDLFWKLFCIWKENVRLDEKEKWINRIQKLVARRVDGIMEANRRNYYGECAAFVAAIGEVKESFGEIGAKAKIMEGYKREYSRRRAFHQELREYGMMW